MFQPFGLKCARGDALPPGAHALGSPSHSAIFVTLVIGWLLVKLAFVHVVIPIRNHDRQPRLKGELLARHVPAGVTLHLDRLKDDGLLFYYGRPTQRVNLQLPTSHSTSRYAILTLAEFRVREQDGCLPVLWLRDQQGEAIVLARLHGPTN